MDELTPFERRLAAELDRMAGPGRRIDAPAMVRAVSTRSPRWRFPAMFGAARFAVAAAVALAGAFVLSGVIPRPRSDDPPPAIGAASPSPVTTEALLSGMVTQEVEPGVVRVLDDGAGHDLAGMQLGGVWTGGDGSIWALEEPFDGAGYGFRLLRLARPGDHPIDIGSSYWFDMAVDADGMVWAREGADHEDGWLATNDGATVAWRPREWAVDEPHDVEAVETGPDGSIWVTRAVKDGPGPWVARHDDSGWTIVPPSDDPELQGRYFAHGPYMDVGPDGTVWLANGNHHVERSRGPHGVLRFDGSAWVVDSPLPERTDLHAGPLAVGPEGTAWVYLGSSEETLPAGADRFLLARWSGGAWTTYGETDGVLKLVSGQRHEARLAVDQAGTLWIAFENGSGVDLHAAPATAGLQAPTPAEGPCPGVLSFDGTAWRQYLRGRCVNHVAVAADGSIWASAATIPDQAGMDIHGLYVITPEAAATAAARE